MKCACFRNYVNKDIIKNCVCERKELYLNMNKIIKSTRKGVASLYLNVGMQENKRIIINRNSKGNKTSGCIFENVFLWNPSLSISISLLHIKPP